MDRAALALSSNQSDWDWGWDGVSALSTALAAVAAILSLIFLIMQHRSEYRPYLEIVADTIEASKNVRTIVLRNTGKRAAYNIEVKGPFINEKRDILYPGESFDFDFSNFLGSANLETISYKRYFGILKLYLIKNSKSKSKKESILEEKITSFEGRLKLKKFLSKGQRYINNASRVAIAVTENRENSILTLRWPNNLMTDSFSVEFNSSQKSMAFEIYRIFGNFKLIKNTFYWEMKTEEFVHLLKNESYLKCLRGDSSKDFDLDFNELVRVNLKDINWNNSKHVSNEKAVDLLNVSGENNERYCAIQFGFFDSSEINILPGNYKEIGKSIFLYDNRRAMIESAALKIDPSPYGFALYDKGRKRLIIKDDVSRVPILLQMSPKVDRKFFEIYSLVQETYHREPDLFYKAKPSKLTSRIISAIYWSFFWSPKKRELWQFSK
jgi:hypothetical protein